MSFLVRLEGIASAQTPQEAAAELLTYAKHICCGVIANINGVEAWAYPHEAEKDVIDRWNYLWSTISPRLRERKGWTP